jgi:hypothetical protein
MDHNNKYVNIETGVGVGVTDGADKLTFKLMLSRDINSKGVRNFATGRSESDRQRVDRQHDAAARQALRILEMQG